MLLDPGSDSMTARVPKIGFSASNIRATDRIVVDADEYGAGPQLVRHGDAIIQLDEIITIASQNHVDPGPFQEISDPEYRVEGQILFPLERSLGATGSAIVLAAMTSVQQDGREFSGRLRIIRYRRLDGTGQNDESGNCAGHQRAKGPSGKSHV